MHRTMLRTSLCAAIAVLPALAAAQEGNTQRPNIVLVITDDVGYRLEGINLLPVLEGRAPAIDRALFWRVTGQQAVRSGDWKLLMDGGRALLFDLRADIAERHNLIGQRSDIARRLQPLLAAWQADVDAEAKRATSR